MKIHPRAHIPRIERIGDGNIKAIGPCYISGEEYSTKEFNEGRYMSWILKRDTIQNLLPELTAEDREFLITGISPKSWNEMYNEENN